LRGPRTPPRRAALSLRPPCWALSASCPRETRPVNAPLMATTCATRLSCRRCWALSGCQQRPCRAAARTPAPGRRGSGACRHAPPLQRARAAAAGLQLRWWRRPGQPSGPRRKPLPVAPARGRCRPAAARWSACDAAPAAVFPRPQPPRTHDWSRRACHGPLRPRRRAAPALTHTAPRRAAGFAAPLCLHSAYPANPAL
jgi:hypothetical protein